MTLEALLKQYGLDDATIAKILGGMKENKIYTAAEENLDTRYSKLKGDHEALNGQYTEAQTLIEQLKKDTKGNESLQGKITEYEGKVTKLEEENKKLKVESAVKVKLLEAKADDIEYLMYKIDKKDDLKIGEDGSIEGLDGIITELQTKYPTHFETGDEGKAPKIIEKKLGGPSDPETGVTKEQFEKMGYNARLNLKKENPDAYRTLAGDN